ncbi:MAG TPA: hypothetical protein VIK77_02865 [Tissierellaceae bacterium]
MSGCCGGSTNFSSLTGPTGNGISSITSKSVAGGIEVTVNMTNGSTSVFVVPAGPPGNDGNTIDHVSFTQSSNPSDPNTAGQAGYQDLYTIWQDAGETISYGTFIVTNGSNGTTPVVSMANVGAGANIFVSGSGPNPFYLRTLTSSDGSLLVTQNPTIVDLRIKPSNWITVNPVGTSSTTNPVYFNSGPFTNVSDDLTYGQPTAFRLDYPSNKVHMRGAMKFTGSASIGMNPTGPYNTTTIVCMTFASALIGVLTPPIGQVRFTTAQLYNPVRKHASTVLVAVSSSTLSLIVDHGFNYVDSNTLISFENTSYSL